MATVSCRKAVEGHVNGHDVLIESRDQFGKTDFRVHLHDRLVLVTRNEAKAVYFAMLAVDGYLKPVPLLVPMATEITIEGVRCSQGDMLLFMRGNETTVAYVSEVNSFNAVLRIQDANTGIFNSTMSVLRLLRSGWIYTTCLGFGNAEALTRMCSHVRLHTPLGRVVESRHAVMQTLVDQLKEAKHTSCELPLLRLNCGHDLACDFNLEDRELDEGEISCAVL